MNQQIEKSDLITCNKFCELIIRKLKCQLSRSDCCYIFERIDCKKKSKISLPFFLNTYISIPPKYIEKKDKIKYQLYRILLDLSRNTEIQPYI